MISLSMYQKLERLDKQLKNNLKINRITFGSTVYFAYICITPSEKGFSETLKH